MPDRDVQDGDDLEEEGPAKSQPKRRRTRVTAREAASYRLFQRSQDSNHILRAGRLLEEFAVDQFSKVEQLNLKYIRFYQKRLRADLYQGIADAVSAGDP